jgi:predicted Zn-dependent protease
MSRTLWRMLGGTLERVADEDAPALGRRAAASDDFGLVSQDQLSAVAEKALKLSTADGVQVDVGSNVQGNTRFAANQLTTAGDLADTSLTVQSYFGPKHAVVQTNDLSDESIRYAVTQSEAAARLAPDDPEAMPALPPQQYTNVNAFFDDTAAVTASDRAQAALGALGPARTSKTLTAAGFIVTSAQNGLTVNKAGLSAYFRSTSSNYQLTVRTTDGTGSGWAAADDHDWSKLDTKGVAERALDKAQRAAKPVAIEPGRYTVIFEPQAVGDLVQLILNYGGAREADEGRSPFVKASGGNKIGEKIVDSRITLFSDPTDPQLLSQPFDGEGLPLGRQVWIENGVLKQLYYTRFWAKKQGKTATGQPQSVKLAGGTTSVDQMIKDTDRGVLVTRLWYLREVDPRTILYTGLTRDGTFLIENGKVTKAIRNFRFNDSPLFMLNNVVEMGPPERLAGTEQGGDVAMPAIKAKDFTFTSLSEAV